MLVLELNTPLRCGMWSGTEGWACAHIKAATDGCVITMSCISYFVSHFSKAFIGICFRDGIVLEMLLLSTSTLVAVP